MEWKKSEIKQLEWQLRCAGDRESRLTLQLKQQECALVSAVTLGCDSGVLLHGSGIYRSKVLCDNCG